MYHMYILLQLFITILEQFQYNQRVSKLRNKPLRVFLFSSSGSLLSLSKQIKIPCVNPGFLRRERQVTGSDANPSAGPLRANAPEQPPDRHNSCITCYHPGSVICCDRYGSFPWTQSSLLDCAARFCDAT